MSEDRVEWTGGSNRRYTPEVSKARAAERSRRNAEARRRAWVLLAERHRDEFEMLREHMKDGVDREKGPLPGDA